MIGADGSAFLGAQEPRRFVVQNDEGQQVCC
jgi:hypothetical protein